MPAQPGRAICATETSNVSETPTLSSSRTETPSPCNTIKEISDLINRGKRLARRRKGTGSRILEGCYFKFGFLKPSPAVSSGGVVQYTRLCNNQFSVLISPCEHMFLSELRMSTITQNRQMPSIMLHVEFIGKITGRKIDAETS